MPHVFYMSFSAMLPTVLLAPNLLEDAYSGSGQMHGDKECPFSGVTSSGRVLEEGARKQGLEYG